MNKTIAQKDAEFAIRGCQLGIYDKWYRYNREDDGQAYVSAWVAQNHIIQNDSIIWLNA